MDRLLSVKEVGTTLLLACVLSLPYVSYALAYRKNRTVDGPIDPELEAQLQAGIFGYTKTLQLLSSFRVIRARLGWHEWNPIRMQVFERDDYTCLYCGRPSEHLEADHLNPHSKGGSDDLSNLVTACRTCNRRKGDMERKDWLKLVRQDIIASVRRPA